MVAAAATLLPVLHLRSLARVLGGHVMSDQTAGPGAEQAVMTGKMAGDTADDRTLAAAGGLSRRSRRAGGKQWKCKDQRASHRFLSLS
jgi:hypothetical protein